MKINSTTIAIVGVAGLAVAYFMNLGGFKDMVGGLLQKLPGGGGAPVGDAMPDDSESARARYY